MLILLRKSQMGLFATIPVHVKGSVRRDGTRVADHMSVRRKKLEPHQAQHQGGLFGDAPAAVAAVGAKLGAKLSQFLARHGGAARMADTLASFTPEQRAKMLDMMATLGGVSANEVHQALRASTDNRLAAKPAETGEPDLFSQPEASAPAPAKTSPRAMTDLNEDDVKQIKEAARYLKDVAYSTANLVDGDKNVMVRLSSELGKSGRGTLIMDAFNVTRDVAHSINNSLDVSQPRTLRAVDMEDAFTMFPKLRGIVDAARSKPAATAASTETHTTNVPEPAKAAEETSQAQAPQAEGASVPPGGAASLQCLQKSMSKLSPSCQKATFTACQKNRLATAIAPNAAQTFDFRRTSAAVPPTRSMLAAAVNQSRDPSNAAPISRTFSQCAANGMSTSSAIPRLTVGTAA